MTRSSLLCVVLCTLLAFSHATDLARRLKSAARHTTHRRRASAASQSKVFEGMNASQNAKLNLLRQASEAGLLSTSQAWALAERVAFEGFEHAVGSGFAVTNPATQIMFKWIANDGTIIDKSTNQEVLTSKDGVQFSFAMMTASAGDYWSVKDAVANVICAQNVGGTGTQQSRFHTAFDDMWENKKFGRSAPMPSWLKRDKYKEMQAGRLMTTLQEQLKAEFLKERAGVFPTGLPHDFTDATPLVASAPHRGSQHYEKSPMGAGQVVADIFNSDTAAGFSSVAGMALADGNLNALPYNDDHFSECAMNTYAFGHNEAVDDAYAAGQKWRVAAPNARAAIAADLNAAYAKEGFVSHFLSDSFSAGHMRTPRLEIRSICTAWTGKGRDITQGLTANVMHDEDNWNCLLVQNAATELWWACGDHRFFDDENAQNRRHLRDTIEATVHQVSDAFIAGTLNQPNPRTVQGWVAAGVAGAGHTPVLNRYSLENTCPMFRRNNGAWEARTDATITTTPRPPQAMTAAKYGSSIRESMSPILFPAKSTAVKVKLDNDPIPGVHQALDCAYHPMTNSDCCGGSMSRATPLFAADPTPGVDVKANPTAKGPLTADPTNKAKRVTFVNACDATQKLVAAGKAVKSGAVAVAETAYDGLVAYGHAAAMMNGMPILHH